MTPRTGMPFEQIRQARLRRLEATDRTNPDAPQDDNEWQQHDAAYDPEAPDGGHAADYWAEIWPESVDDD